MTDRVTQPSRDAPVDKLAVLEETATVSTREVVTGRVRIAAHVETVEEIARAALRTDDVEVTRVPIDKPVTGPVPTVRTEGDLTIIPILEEIMVVEKRLMLKEELHVRRRQSTEIVDVPVSLKRQRVDISRS